MFVFKIKEIWKYSNNKYNFVKKMQQCLDTDFKLFQQRQYI